MSEKEKKEGNDLRKKYIKEFKKRENPYKNENVLFLNRFKMNISENGEQGYIFDYKTGKSYSLFHTGWLENPTDEFIGWPHSPELIRSLEQFLDDMLLHGDIVRCKKCRSIIRKGTFKRQKLNELT